MCRMKLEKRKKLNAKTAYLANHFSSGELKEKYLKSKDSVEARRWHLLWKVSQGWTIKNSEIALSRLFRL